MSKLTPQILEAHPAFNVFENPVSGAVTYVLRNLPGAVHKGLYFVCPSLRGDEGVLWFTTQYPPSPQPFLSAIRLVSENPAPANGGEPLSVRKKAADVAGGRHTDGCLEPVVYPGMQLGGNPWIAPDGQSAWAPVDDGIYIVPFDDSGSRGSAEPTAPEVFFRVPRELAGGRKVFRLATELTLTADGRWFVLDMQIGGQWLVALLEKETGDFTPLQWFGHNHHHAICSPVHPELFLISQGHYTDPISGHKNPMHARIWIMDTKGKRYEPLIVNQWFGKNSMACHEWWTPGGKAQWCDYDKGIFEADIDEKVPRLVWPRKLIHGQVSPSGRYLCGDYHPYKWNEREPCNVYFLDTETGREVEVASHMPRPPLPDCDVRAFHTDPHPSFSDSGQWLVYTNTLNGNVSVGLSYVPQLAAL